MALKTCEEFLRDALDPARFGREMKAVTEVPEIVELGRRHGYGFTAEEFLTKAMTFDGTAAGGTATDGQQAPLRTPPAEAPAHEAPARATATSFAHYEYRLDELPEFASVVAELPRLKVMPPSARLDRFAGHFREEDARTVSQSPADPAYQAWHRDLAARGWQDEPAAPGAPRRDFHLVNLDEHVDYPGYEDYFAAKTRVVAALENLFGGEVRASGSMWYPPSSYRLWHTNADQPGWRMYLVDVDRPFADPGQTSFFRYLHPRTREIVTLTESPRIVRFFKVEQDPEKLFWHCIANPTDRHRWSFGYVVPETWMDALRHHG
ncbi:Nif11-like leader peptide family natural product precursor [Streptomyces sp. SCA3-4]|uniref:Nif11-like leader peptide family natural product precursor n=1 Tax=Streptomyces sichuanensis TaxID=2871810 RepID=UPI001CE293FC|nr:Nif11-like leader peptide family natural product precursor [Streptomyces sichuanensis]MCA6092857.1 Nif11-like leader peptide family natural product precursor [Streptomyces sichuanensis]